jgi:hypothetical protein
VYFCSLSNGKRHGFFHALITAPDLVSGFAGLWVIILKQFKWFSEFYSSLKSPWAEEIIDLIFYRPAAFLFVKLLSPFPITPNQVSCIAMLFGVTAGYFFTWGDHRGFIIGAILYGLSNIFDCCDGMIARLKKNGTPTGRIVDGLVDYVTGIAVYAGFGVGLAKAAQAGSLHFPCNSWVLMIIASVSIIVHAVLSDKYRNAFLEQLKNPQETQVSEIEKMRSELARLAKLEGHFFDKFLVGIYIRYLHLQVGKPQIKHAKQNVGSSTVFMWNLIGPSTHISFLIVPAFFYCPSVFFFFVIGAANAWVLFLFLLQMIKKNH